MDNKNSNIENTSEGNTEKGFEHQIAQLKNTVKNISSELETIKQNIQTRKTENTTLKILFYTGLIVLLLGFLYTNSTLQRAQMDSLESSIHTLQTLMNRELMSVEKNVYGQIDRLEKNSEESSKSNLQERLENMSLALSRLSPGDAKTAELIDRVKRDSLELSREYAEHQKLLATGRDNTNGEVPRAFENKAFGGN
ncbi:MAG: hypothetical protein O3A78_04085 [Nitrospinae bacterium]|jgi:regulator of replication initiation timing|nr:hypothetical protein [Nitrospinota bacterium]MDA1108986.1 hypothetical protein [Nitrospinota bacterium]